MFTEIGTHWTHTLPQFFDTRGGVVNLFITNPFVVPNQAEDIATLVSTKIEGCIGVSSLLKSKPNFQLRKSTVQWLTHVPNLEHILR